MEPTKRLDLARETYVLLVIYIIDLAVTAWLVLTGQAAEGNPIMSYYMSKGWGILVGMKAVLFVLPIFVLEWCRRYRTIFVHRMLRFAIIVYVGMYVAAFASAAILAQREDASEEPGSNIQQGYSHKNQQPA
ncbi:MAG TPA: DUF5658 family protein [Armatimonadota bacterium]|nr:DUF5658 family protein [Armatimonadota bacterium]